MVIDMHGAPRAACARERDNHCPKASYNLVDLPPPSVAVGCGDDSQPCVVTHQGHSKVLAFSLPAIQALDLGHLG